MSRFINFEGLHAVGKSTISESLANAIAGAKLIPTIPESMQSARQLADETTNINVRFLFYLSAVTIAANKIKTALANGDTIITESFIYRTIAFHQAMGASINIELQDLELPIPDISFHLLCDEEARKVRSSTRRTTSYWSYRAEQKTQEILKAYADFPMTQIDTTNYTRERVLELVLSHLDI